MTNTFICDADEKNIFTAQFFNDGSVRVTHVTFGPLGPITSVVPLNVESLEVLLNKAKETKANDNVVSIKATNKTTKTATKTKKKPK